MVTVTGPETPETFADLYKQIGEVPLERILMRPAPGMATEEDVIALLDAADKRLCELVDGVLVEKTMGAEESLLTGILIELLWGFVRPRKLGWVMPPDGAVRLFPKLVRIPDVSFIRRERAPGGKFPKVSLLDLVPDLAVEVLSPSNTKAEMGRKLRDYFLAGIPVVWLINPRTRSAEVYTSPDKKKRVGINQALRGGAILPGFSLTLKELFNLAEE
jgi:Uma2 family endonuclease